MTLYCSQYSVEDSFAVMYFGCLAIFSRHFKLLQNQSHVRKRHSRAGFWQLEAPEMEPPATRGPISLNTDFLEALLLEAPAGWRH